MARNVNAAKEAFAFADESISRGRELVAKPVAGKQSELVDSVRGAESALQQATSMLDAVDSAASDIRKAVSTRLRRSRHPERHQPGRCPAGPGRAGQRRRLSRRARRGGEAVTAAQSTGAADPLGAFTQLTEADAHLDRLLAAVAEEREAAERLSRSYDQALFTAQSRVRSVSDYVDTRRGSIGPEARTRLNEAVRQLEAPSPSRSPTSPRPSRTPTAQSLLAAKPSSSPTTTAGRPARLHESLWRRWPFVGHGACDRRFINGQHPVRRVRAAAASAGGGGWTSTTYGGLAGLSGRGNLGGGGRFGSRAAAGEAHTDAAAWVSSHFLRRAARAPLS